ncbi:aldehyde dehydrogenase family protein [Thalassobacillus devorans]|uniref:aldehyde dehydrogenase family protein n=1 Tax=Thalassobacillus devorans TaxID=279813 RepID=UPI0004B127E6|nr:aldehyde dehydrogenase family protein [Thalassobacillus devorans]
MQRYKNFINGQWVHSGSGKNFSVNNPANKQQKLGEVDIATEIQVREAVKSAKTAFGKWKNSSPVERGSFLQEVANVLEKNCDDIAETCTKEMGKRLAETKGEVLRSVTILRYYAQEGMRDVGEMLPSINPNNTLYSIRVPLGVVGVISPWNFPVAIPIWKIAPALIYGNTIVWKPSELTSIAATRIVQCFEQAGLPKGVINVVHGGPSVGDAIVTDPDTSAITFTGSNKVGRTIAEKAAGLNKKYQLELGGKNPAIVLEDADLELAARLVFDGAMKQTGQRCTATSRAFIHESIYEEFKSQLLNHFKKIKIGNGMEDNVDMGPLASSKQLETVKNYIDKGVSEGANLLHGGNLLENDPYERGCFIEPTLFDQVTNSMTIAQEEIFGPVLSLIRVNSYEEALKQANDTKYGLSASLFTNNLETTFHFIKNSEAGMVQINGETGGAEPQAPFGGMKESSSGTREQGQAAKEFFTAFKTISISNNL